jgi:hypothetical protein
MLPLSYQWFLNGDALAGETNASLVLSSIQPAQEGACAVIVSNFVGSVTSSIAILMVNEFPLADASATLPLVISANGTNALVVLDGTRSSDPDCDALNCLCLSTFTNQPSVPIATGVVAIVVLPVGTHPIDLVVNDGLASSTDSITVAVLTTSEAVQRLICIVNESGLAHPRPLIATLEAALASIQRGNLIAAMNQLQAFQNKVRAQVVPEDPMLAESLIQRANQVIEALGVERPVRHVGKLESVIHQPGGKMHLKFSASSGCIHFVEASTNLVDWGMIGVAVEQGGGSFVFEDADASKFPGRFYRIKQLAR